jgi:hypothetical protein
MKPRANARQAARAAKPDLWCSLGRHWTYASRDIKLQWPGGTVCLSCQMSVVESVRQVIYMPDMSVAMIRRERIKHEKNREARRTESMIAAGMKDATGIVYYIRINGQIKIGFTTNLRQRSRNYPPGSELLAVEPATAYTERDRHQQFQRDRVRGREWFEPSDELEAHIAELAELHGVPTHLMHRFTTRK